jgi:SAM-dependent methyltransferase
MGAVRDFEHAGWQQAAADYDGSFLAATRLFSGALLDAVGEAQDLLDLACGSGVVAEAALRRGLRPVGLDFSPAMLAQGRRRAPALDLREGDAEALPFADAAFDAVVSNFGVHHVERPRRALAEAFRVLRPGGGLAFTLWAPPEENPAWRLLFDAVRAHGRLDVALPAGAEGLSGVAAFAAATAEAGFGEAWAEPANAVWRLPGEADLVGIFAAGTVRTARLIDAQPAEARAAIRAHVAEALRDFAPGGEVELPIRAYVISAVKPPAP